MSKMCEICSKSSKVGRQISYSQRKSSRKFKANLQKTKILNPQGELVQVTICTRCLKKIGK